MDKTRTSIQEFDGIYVEYHEDIFRFLLKLTLFRADLAEELTQETFYQAYLKIDTFKGLCHVRSWLCQIAKNLYYSYLRKNQRQTDLHREISTAAFEETDDKKRIFCETMKVIHSLNAMNRDVVLYRLLFDMPYAQIAGLLGISENSAKVIFFRSKREVRAKMQKEYLDEL